MSRIMIQILATVVKMGRAALCPIVTQVLVTVVKVGQTALYPIVTQVLVTVIKKNGACSATSPIMIQILAAVVKVGDAPLSYRDKCFSNCRQSGTYSAMSVLS